MEKRYGALDIILLLFSPFISLCYILTPLNNDIRIFFGVSHLAANYFPFPESIDLAWELKPVGNRLINFILYKIATSFVPFSDRFGFTAIVKFVSLIAIIIVAWYFSRKVNVHYSFFLVFYSMITLAIVCMMQAEFWAALVAILAIASILSDKYYSNVFAGGLLVFLPLIKGITGLMIVSVICGAYLLDPRVRVKIFKVFFGILVSCMIVIDTAFTIWPNMISDTLMSPILAQVGMRSLFEHVAYFLMYFYLSPICIPVLFIGFIFGAILFFARIKQEPLKIRLAYGLMWIAPVIIVFVTGEMFLYHYLVFVPPAIVSIILCERYSE